MLQVCSREGLDSLSFPFYILETKMSLGDGSTYAPMPYFRVLQEEQRSCFKVLCNLKTELEHVDSSSPGQKKKNTKTASSDWGEGFKPYSIHWEIMLCFLSRELAQGPAIKGRYFLLGPEASVLAHSSCSSLLFCTLFVNDSCSNSFASGKIKEITSNCVGLSLIESP